MVSYSQYKRGLKDGTDDLNGFSPSIWADAQVELQLAEGTGFIFFDDFTTGTLTAEGGDHEWVITQQTAGTVVEIAGVGGILLIDSASGTADQGIEAQAYRSGVTTALHFIPTADTKMYFEVRLAIGDTPVGAQLFAGLSEIDTSMFASGANTSSNHLGFEMNALTQAGTAGTAGKANFYGEKADARNTAAAEVGLDVHEFTDAGTGGATVFADGAAWVKLGFIVDGVTDVRLFVNGQSTGDVIPTANVPILGLVPTLCLLSEGVSSADPTMQIDWIRVFQTRPR